MFLRLIPYLNRPFPWQTRKASTNGTVILTATLFQVDNGVVPKGKLLTFIPLVGIPINGDSFITNDSSEATYTVSLAGFTPQTSSYTVQFAGDPADDDDGFDSSESAADLVVTEAPVVPDPPKIDQATDPTLSKSAVAPSNASDVDPYTGQTNPNPYSGVSNIDPFTGAPKADAFTGVPTSQVPESVRSFINEVFSQPPVDFSGVPQSVQNAILDIYNRPGVPGPIQDAILDIYDPAPYPDFLGYAWRIMQSESQSCLNQCLRLSLFPSGQFRSNLFPLFFQLFLTISLK